MKLWLISQTVNRGYDTYDSAVVAAADEMAARLTSPSGEWLITHGWCVAPDQVTAKYIGDAKEGQQAGVILASFNAG